MKVKTIKVISIGGLQTEEEFTHSFETTPVIALWNENLICWYEKRTCSKLKGIRGKVLSCKRTFIIEKNGKTAVYSLDGLEIIPFDNYDYIREHCYAIEVRINHKSGAYSYEGKLIVPTIYDRLVFAEEGISSKFGFLKQGLHSYNGETIISDDYTICYTNDIGMICSDKNGLYGVYSSDGDIVVPFEYESLAQYKKCILAQKNGKCGMLSNTGKLLVPFEYEDISPVSKDNHDYFIAKKEEHFGHALYKYTGKEILEPIYNDISYEEKNCVIVLKKGDFGLYTVDGLELLKPIYEGISSVNDNIFLVKTAGGEFYYISSLNRRIYADEVYYDNAVYMVFNDGVWTLID